MGTGDRWTGAGRVALCLVERPPVLVVAADDRRQHENTLERGGEPRYGADGGRELLVEQQLRQLLVLGTEDLQDGGDEVSELLHPFCRATTLYRATPPEPC